MTAENRQGQPNSTPQEQSNAPRTPEMRIAGVNITEYRSGIPLSGFDSVAAALHTFASGRSRGGRATQKDLEDNLSRDHGAMGLGLYLLSTARIDRSGFVNDMLQEAEPAVKGERGRWERHYDYDAMGTSFFKSTVEITRLSDQDDGYLLGLNAAYVGKQVEDGLAETLGVEQGLQWKGVNVILEPDGNNFRIDFDQIASRLQSLYSELEPAVEPKNLRQRVTEAVKGSGNGRSALTGESIIRTLLATNRWGGDTNSFVLGVKDGVEVSLSLGRVGDRFNWKNGNRNEEQWKTEGAVVTGSLAESYEEEGKLEPPAVTFTIRRYSEDRYDRLPAIDPAMKTTMSDLASKIAASFSPAE